MNRKWKIFLPCYFAFLVNGMMVLEVGTILPYLIKEAGLSYSIAGGLLSAFAIGNFLASFVNPFFIEKLGRKFTVICLSSLIPLSLLGITFLPSVVLLYLLFVLLGIGRGTVSIFNNTVVNEQSNGSNAALNFLHMSFAIGAFLAPFLTSLYINIGLTWRHIVYTIIGLLIIALFFLINVAKDDNKAIKQKNNNEENHSYFKSVDFYVIGLVLFFYLGLENCVNGWFVTYFKSTKIMSDTYATNLVSVTWVAVMIGRLVTASLSKKINKKTLILINCIFTAVFFLLLVATKNITVISISIAMLGFFFAGIYPTCIANAGTIIKGSSSGMSMLLAIAALGGIVFPKIIGVIADYIGLTGAIGFLTISTSCMVVFALINYKRKNIV